MHSTSVNRLAIVLASLAMCSCSSFINTFREQSYWHDPHQGCPSQIYGGTCLNLTILRAKQDPIGLARFTVPLALVDLPLSFVADTVFLPINIAQKVFDLNRAKRPATYDPCAPFSNSQTACVQHGGCGVTNVNQDYPELFSCVLVDPDAPPVVNYDVRSPLEKPVMGGHK